MKKIKINSNIKIMDNLKKICELVGLLDEYKDMYGEKVRVDASLLYLILKHMGYDVDTINKQEDLIKNLTIKECEQGIRYVNSFFVSEADKKIPLLITEEQSFKDIFFSLEDEYGHKISSNYSFKNKIPNKEIEVSEKIYKQFDLPLPDNLDYGYYRLTVDVYDKKYRSYIIIAKDKCYVDERLFNGKKWFGVDVPLYALKSKRNMGIGDYTDLKNFANILHKNGGKVLYVSPLNSLFFNEIYDVSPYRVLDKRTFNYFYLDLEIVDDFKESEKIKFAILKDDFKEKIKKLRESERINYKEVYSLKVSLLKDMYEHFVEKNLDIEKGITEKGIDFYEYIRKKGTSFKELCVFEYLAEKFNSFNWKSWPDSLKDNKSIDFWEFEDNNKYNWQFYAYAHMLSDIQVKEVSDLCKKLDIVFMTEMPFGSLSNSVDVWANKDCFIDGLEIAVKPNLDAFKGENLKYVPYNKNNLIDSDYNVFAKKIRENFDIFDIVRFDYFKYFFNAFVIINNSLVENFGECIGTFIKYDVKDIIAILSLESHKRKCMIVGENFENNQDLINHGIYPMHAFLKNSNKKDALEKVDSYNYNSFLKSGFYDMPTMVGFWLSKDIKLHESLKIYKDYKKIKDNFENRSFVRKNLIQEMNKKEVFCNQNDLLYLKQSVMGDKVPENFNYNLTKYLAKSDSCVYFLRLEDMVMQSDMIKLKSTTTEYHNWQTKIEICIEDMENDKKFMKFFKILSDENRASLKNY